MRNRCSSVSYTHLDVYKRQLMTETGLLQDEPSMLLMDLGGWTVDLMRIDNAIPAADTCLLYTSRCV